MARLESPDHPSNQDTLTGPKGGRIRGSPLHSTKSPDHPSNPRHSDWSQRVAGSEGVYKFTPSLSKTVRSMPAHVRNQKPSLTPRNFPELLHAHTHTHTHTHTKKKDSNPSLKNILFSYLRNSQLQTECVFLRWVYVLCVTAGSQILSEM